jgi:hypothetical protein
VPKGGTFGSSGLRRVSTAVGDTNPTKAVDASKHRLRPSGHTLYWTQAYGRRRNRGFGRRLLSKTSRPNQNGAEGATNQNVARREVRHFERQSNLMRGCASPATAVYSPRFKRP